MAHGGGPRADAVHEAAAAQSSVNHSQTQIGHRCTAGSPSSTQDSNTQEATSISSAEVAWVTPVLQALCWLLLQPKKKKKAAEHRQITKQRLKSSWADACALYIISFQVRFDPNSSGFKWWIRDVICFFLHYKKKKILNVFSERCSLKWCVHTQKQRKRHAPSCIKIPDFFFLFF